MASIILKLVDHGLRVQFRYSCKASKELFLGHNLQRSSLSHPVRYCSEGPSEISAHKQPLEGHRKAFFGKRRHLSPMQRLNVLVESNDGPGEDRHDSEGNENIQNDGIGGSENKVVKTKHKTTPEKSGSSDQPFPKEICGLDRGKKPLNHGRNSILVDGEFVFVAMENVKTTAKLREMFLLEAGKVFQSRYGCLEHTAIVGHLPGKVFLTDRDVPLLVRRPTLEEYVLYMKRTATISFPKDIAAMLMMADVSPGDVILEAGTGSGAMSLHLSRAVWSGGTIHTYESNASHQKVARKNVEAWRRSYDVSHTESHWPDNICFHSEPLEGSFLESNSVDGAVLDLEEPHQVLPAVADKLKRGRALAIYVSNLTQVVDIMEMIRVRALPLTVEDVIDVTHRHWLVHPARRRQETASLDRLKVLRGSDISIEESSHRSVPGDAEAYIVDHIPKYITRPQHKQPPFSAFLVKVWKTLSSGLKHKR